LPAKSEYESNLALIYAHSNNSSSQVSKVTAVMQFSNDKQTSTDLKKAQLFNDYFYSVFSSSDQPLNNLDTISGSDALQDIVISQSGVYSIPYIPWPKQY